jgi:AraC family transcriptional regulator, chitin signaling transcriptional activator
LKKLVYFISILIIYKTNSQQINNVGTPLIEKFKYESKMNFSHIWQIAEAPNHVMYFVNDNGLLQYDGKNWETYKGNKGIHRSLMVYNNDTIFTGQDNDFGIWRRNKNNRFEYKSLYPFLNKNNKMVEEFWHVYKNEKFVIYHSFTNIYIYDFKNIVKISGQFKSSFQFEDLIYFVDNEGNVSVFDGVNLIDYSHSILIKDLKIIGIINIGLKTLYISKDKGIYELLNGQLKEFSTILNIQLKQNNIFSFTKINKNYFAIGTVLNGTYIIDYNGKIIHNINKIKGLQNNTVLSMFFSKYGKLWLGLDFGIDALHINSKFSFIIDYEGKIGSTYCALLENNNLFLGTNQGLYLSNFNELYEHTNNYNFNLIPNSQGQVWSIKKVNNEILCGHDKGLFVIKNNQLLILDNKPGVWSIANWKNTHLITGNYSGVHIYKKVNNNWKYLKTLPKILGSCNQVLVEKDFLFVRLSNYGVLQIKLNENLDIISKKIYKSDLFDNQNFNIEINSNELIVNTLNKIYIKKLNEENFKSKEANHYNQSLKNELLTENFIASKLNNQFNFYPIYSGFAIENNKIKKTKFDISKILISKSYYNNQNEQINFVNNQDISYKNNNLKFEFIVPNYPHSLKYSYRLKGLSNDWTAWQDKNNIEFVNLKHGKYKLEIKAKDDNIISKTTTFNFQIIPPFYKSYLAYFIYFIIFLYVIYLIRFFHFKKLKIEKLALLKIQKENLNEQSKKYQEKILLEQQEKLILEQKQLKLTLENKELELAKKIIDQKEINELIFTIRKKLEDSQKNANQKMSPKNYNEFLSFLDKKVNKDLNKEYDIAFDSSQTHFHDNLLKSHPYLTTKDLRIASYLTMNLSSKEIAKLLQVLPSSIDVNRSRLRKKLNIEEDVVLRDYLNKFM